MAREATLRRLNIVRVLLTRSLRVFTRPLEPSNGVLIDVVAFVGLARAKEQPPVGSGWRRRRVEHSLRALQSAVFSRAAQGQQKRAAAASRMSARKNNSIFPQETIATIVLSPDCRLIEVVQRHIYWTFLS